MVDLNFGARMKFVFFNLCWSQVRVKLLKGTLHTQNEFSYSFAFVCSINFFAHVHSRLSLSLTFSLFGAWSCFATQNEERKRRNCSCGLTKVGCVGSPKKRRTRWEGGGRNEGKKKKKTKVGGREREKKNL